MFDCLFDDQNSEVLYEKSFHQEVYYTCKSWDIHYTNGENDKALLTINYEPKNSLNSSNSARKVAIDDVVALLKSRTSST